MHVDRKIGLELEGSKFQVTDPSVYGILFVAYLARKGDANAKAFLKAANLVIMDDDEGMFWPSGTPEDVVDSDAVQGTSITPPKKEIVGVKSDFSFPTKEIAFPRKPGLPFNGIGAPGIVSLSADRILTVDLKHLLIDTILEVPAFNIVPPELAPRSGKWPKLRAVHMHLHPECAVCGTKEECVPHHVKPFHIWPALELDPDNLITLCNSRMHHLIFGHLMNWASYNKDVVKHAELFNKLIATRPTVEVPSKAAMQLVVDEQATAATHSETKCDTLLAEYPEIANAAA